MIHTLNPIVFYLGPLPIKWYPLAYIIGIVAGFFYIKFAAKKQNLNLPSSFMDDLFCCSIISIIIGGRLGHVLIYDLEHYLKHPLEILQTWRGGMSFHGGLLGFIVAAVLVARKHKINPWVILDLSACIAPLGIFLGRLANFINGELFGKAANLPWSVIFVNTGGGSEPRHPSQIYEALTEGLLLFFIMNALFLFTRAKKFPGLLAGIFAIFYSIFRFAMEYFKLPDAHVLGFNIGQILSLFMFVVGCWITFISAPRKFIK